MQKSKVTFSLEYYLPFLGGLTFLRLLCDRFFFTSSLSITIPSELVKLYSALKFWMSKINFGSKLVTLEPVAC